MSDLDIIENHFKNSPIRTEKEIKNYNLYYKYLNEVISPFVDKFRSTDKFKNKEYSDKDYDLFIKKYQMLFNKGLKMYLPHRLSLN